jgi:hypothetical protein
MRAKVFDGVNAVVPAKKSKVQAVGLHSMTQALGGKLR